MFIAIDGPSGVGKTSIIEGIKNKLGNEKKIFITREPSETEFGQYVKKKEEIYSEEHYCMLIASDRQYHIDTIIQPRLTNGETVICDRYIASSLVLQNFDGVDIDKIWEMNKYILIPDIYIIVSASDKEIEERLSKREHFSKFEKKMSRAEEIEYFSVAAHYLQKRNFNVLCLNNNKGDLEMNVHKIVKLINELD